MQREDEAAAVSAAVSAVAVVASVAAVAAVFVAVALVAVPAAAVPALAAFAVSAALPTGQALLYEWGASPAHGRMREGVVMSEQGLLVLEMLQLGVDG